MDPNVPLVIPEINGNRIREHKGIIAVPNCSASAAGKQVLESVTTATLPTGGTIPAGYLGARAR